MRTIVWLARIMASLGYLAAGLTILTTFTAWSAMVVQATSAPQEAAASSMALVTIVASYCVARCFGEVATYLGTPIPSSKGDALEQ